MVGRSPFPREFYSWYFLRVSGLLLIFLALGHFLIMHVAHSILEVDYAFAARRWAVPAWRVYDWLLLALALLHGFNGLRVVVDEWVRPPRLRRAAADRRGRRDGGLPAPGDVRRGGLPRSPLEGGQARARPG